jgi:hypothetical protein
LQRTKKPTKGQTRAAVDAAKKVIIEQRRKLEEKTRYFPKHPLQLDVPNRYGVSARPRHSLLDYYQGGTKKDSLANLQWLIPPEICHWVALTMNTLKQPNPSLTLLLRGWTFQTRARAIEHKVEQLMCVMWPYFLVYFSLTTLFSVRAHSWR